MKALFDIAPINQRKEKCKDCEFITHIEYGTRRKIFYCKKRRSNRTQNNLLKIKANRTACGLFKTKTNE